VVSYITVQTKLDREWVEGTNLHSICQLLLRSAANVYTCSGLSKGPHLAAGFAALALHGGHIVCLRRVLLLLVSPARKVNVCTSFGQVTILTT
jgi:hypothetical protein